MPEGSVIQELVLGIVDDLNELNDDPDSLMGEYPEDDEYDVDQGTIEFTNTKDGKRYRIEISEVAHEPQTDYAGL